MRKIEIGLTYDDVLLIPKKSALLPEQISFRTKFTPRFSINIPLISAAMDTVTDAKMAIEMRRLGGVGVLHRNNTIEDQVAMVKQVNSATKIESADEDNQKTSNEPETTIVIQSNQEPGVMAASSPLDKTSNQPVPLPQSSISSPIAAAVGFYGDAYERAQKLRDAGVNVLVVDTAHGHSKAVIEMVAKLKADREFADLDIVAGNIATAEAANDLVEAGADALKVGIGPGSICTTRVVAGVGVPQLSAVQAVSQIADRHNIPVIADGGINYSGDIAKAIVGGAWTVMCGSQFAGTDESPGEIKEIDGRKVKVYRGMGSLGVMARGTQSFSKDRYFQNTTQTIVPEGITGTIAYKGPIEFIIDQLLGGLRQSMFYLGARRILDLKANGQFIRISPAGLRESHPHGLLTIQATSNYQ
ncbi:MAG: IMP dehydrogenase [Bifidobacteriaceae bacterium]|jgi:IMP dehydrogenase|nr:IMP dehydrogenase [Bifidobacteriaceae bacterium]